MRYPGIQSLERKLQEVAAPLTDLIDSKRESIRRSTHEPVAVEMRSPMPETLHRALAWTGSFLQSDQVQIAVDLMQRWRDRGEDNLVDDFERTARFPTSMKTEWETDRCAVRERLFLQSHFPVPEFLPREFPAQTTGLELVREENTSGLPPALTGLVRWSDEHRAQRDPQSTERWCSAEYISRDLAGRELPPIFRVPRVWSADGESRQLPLGEGIELHYRTRPAPEAPAGKVVEVYRGTVESSAVPALFDRLAIRPLMGNQELLHGFNRFLHTLAAPERSTLREAHHAARAQNGLHGITWRLHEYFGFQGVRPPQGEISIQFRNYSNLQEMVLGQCEDSGRNALSLRLCREGPGAVSDRFRIFSAHLLARQLEPLSGYLCLRRLGF